jgi:hypothetical protein
MPDRDVACGMLVDKALSHRLHEIKSAPGFVALYDFARNHIKQAGVCHAVE